MNAERVRHFLLRNESSRVVLTLRGGASFTLPVVRDEWQIEGIVKPGCDGANEGDYERVLVTSNDLHMLTDEIAVMRVL